MVITENWPFPINMYIHKNSIHTHQDQESNTDMATQ